MKRTLYDSRAIPLDLLMAEMFVERRRFGDPAPDLIDRDAPKPDTEEELDNG